MFVDIIKSHVDGTTVIFSSCIYYFEYSQMNEIRKNANIDLNFSVGEKYFIKTLCISHSCKTNINTKTI